MDWLTPIVGAVAGLVVVAIREIIAARRSGRSEIVFTDKEREQIKEMIMEILRSQEHGATIDQRVLHKLRNFGTVLNARFERKPGEKALEYSDFY